MHVHVHVYMYTCTWMCVLCSILHRLDYPKYTHTQNYTGNTVYVEIFAGIYFHYFANLKDFVTINSTCSVLLSYICQLELNSTLHVELIITKPLQIISEIVKINTSKNFHIYGNMINTL